MNHENDVSGQKKNLSEISNDLCLSFLNKAEKAEQRPMELSFYLRLRRSQSSHSFTLIS